HALAGKARSRVDPVEAQRIDVVERPEFAGRVPPPVREVAEFLQLGGIGVHGRHCPKKEAPPRRGFGTRARSAQRLEGFALEPPPAALPAPLVGRASPAATSRWPSTWISTRRSGARQATSFWLVPLSGPMPRHSVCGWLSPMAWTSMRCGSTPFLTRYSFTASARRWESRSLYSCEAMRSVWPIATMRSTWAPSIVRASSSSSVVAPSRSSALPKRKRTSEARMKRWMTGGAAASGAACGAGAGAGAGSGAARTTGTGAAEARVTTWQGAAALSGVQSDVVQHWPAAFVTAVGPLVTYPGAAAAAAPESAMNETASAARESAGAARRRCRPGGSFRWGSLFIARLLWVRMAGFAASGRRAPDGSARTSKGRASTRSERRPPKKQKTPPRRGFLRNGEA